MCPECGSENVRVVEYDYGRCPLTGYHDAGERYECHDCGLRGEPDELQPDRAILNARTTEEDRANS